MSNAFYRMVLGPSLTYSCGVWFSPDVGLDTAQATKHELICQKLALEPDMRLLDVGCGWGSLLLHAARHHGVRGVGVTLSRRQAELASKRVAERNGYVLDGVLRSLWFKGDLREDTEIWSRLPTDP